jgi:NAD(P)-dependent dehydrogenase (short-subunit alcohol dehydrogenase family)
MALALAAAGADIIVASRNGGACEEVASEVRALGRRALAHSCHVGRWEQIDGLIDASYAEFGRIDILINNAGKSPLYDSVTGISEAMFDSVVALNLKGPFRLSAMVGTRMAEGGGGSIVNISSIASENPAADSIPYAAAKAGLNAVTVGLARALAPKVRVNAILPGAFRTDVSAHWTPEVTKKFAEAAALGRVGEPDEITGAVLYLVSDAASFTTGTLLRVDGGAV